MNEIFNLRGCTLLLLLLLAGGQYLFAQKPQGIWHAAFAIDLEARSLARQPKSVDSLMYADEFLGEEIELNPVYRPVPLLFDFQDKQLNVYGMGKIKTFPYSWKNNKLHLRFEGATLIGTLTDTGTVVLVPVKKKYKNDILVLEKPHQAMPGLADSYQHRGFGNTYWKVRTDSSSWLSVLNLHLLDSNKAYFVNDHPESGYSTWGNWEMGTYKDQLYLYVADRQTGNEQFFYIYGKEAGTLLATGYSDESSYTENPPLKHQLRLERKQLLEPDEIEALKQQLVGSWYTTHPFDTAASSLFRVNFKDTYYQLTLNTDNTFSMHLQAKQLKKSVGEEEVLDLTITGRYAINPSGYFIELISKEEEYPFRNVIHIRKVNENLLELSHGLVPGFNKYGHSSLILKRKE